LSSWLLYVFSSPNGIGFYFCNTVKLFSVRYSRDISFVLPAPCPRCVDRCISDNDFAKGMESVLDMVPDILLYRSWKIPLSSQKGCGWLVVAFYPTNLNLF